MTNPYDPQNPYSGNYQHQGPLPAAPPPAAPYGVMYVVGPRNHPLAVTSLVVSIIALLGCCVGLLLGPAAAVMGHIGRREINGQPTRYQGDGMALTGIIIGWAVSAFYFVVLVFLVLGLLGVFDPEVQRDLG